MTTITGYEIRAVRSLRRTSEIVFWLAIACFGSCAAYAQSTAAVDLLRREFIAGDFTVKSFGPVRWLDGGKSYAILEPSSGAEGTRDLVRYDTATAQREVMISASQLTPPDSHKPLVIEDYDWSADMNRVLIFTNSRRVWRENTRGDYWVLDRKSGALRKLGSGDPPSSLMFAQVFSGRVESGVCALQQHLC